MVLLGGIGSWAFYQIINNGVQDLLLLMGIENIYLQNSIIIVFILGVFLLLGLGGKKAFEKIIK